MSELSRQFHIEKACSSGKRHTTDYVAVEEPLEIQVSSAAATGAAAKSISITMRTPGHDYELTTGFLLSEGILRHRQDFSDMRYCLDQSDTVTQEYNQLMITLRNGDLSKLPQLERHFFTNSACGVCGTEGRC